MTRTGRAALAALLCSFAITAPNFRAEAGPLSLLAVGDTGAPPDDPDANATQLAVAEALAASARAHPPDALLLLGDNFYPDGLVREELIERVRGNLVRPYCRFLEIAGPAGPEVERACDVPASDRRPVPVFATLGNHDYRSAESPDLQRQTLRRFFANWRMPLGAAAVYELGRGVSLVILDSNPVFEGADAEPLAEALRVSRGPWRILAAHHPIANRDRGSEAERHARYRNAVLAAVAAARVPVHLVLSGHEHNLQVLTMEPPAPALHAVAGSGSGARSLHGPDPRRHAGFEEPGFARVDLAGEAADARLVVSLYGLPGLPLRLVSDGPQLRARWSVDLAGRVRELRDGRAAEPDIR